MQRSLRVAPRRAALRRPYSAQTSGESVSNAPDNAFNRERKAVKDHAAATSGG